MSLELTVRGKTYKVDVDSRGQFLTRLDGEDGGRNLIADTLKGLEEKLTTATRIRTAKVALKFKRLGQARARRNSYSSFHEDPDSPWEVQVIIVRGVNEHTHQLMVTWPDGTKGDDEKAGRYSRNNHIYFPMDMDDAEILRQRKLIDDAEKWFETHAVDVVSAAKKAVKEALGE